MNTTIKPILTLLFSALFMIGYSQDINNTQRKQPSPGQIDSTISGKIVARVKQYVSITAEQEQALFKVAYEDRQARRTKPKEQSAIKYANQKWSGNNQVTDSLFKNILGEQKFNNYIDSLRVRIQKQQALMEQRVQQLTKSDTAAIKKQTP